MIPLITSILTYFLIESFSTRAKCRMIMVALPTHEGNNPREQTETELDLIQVGQGVPPENLGVESNY